MHIKVDKECATNCTSAEEKKNITVSMVKSPSSKEFEVKKPSSVH